VNAVGLAIADRFDGEYKRVSDKPLNMGIGAEDPFIWIENGKYKALMLDTNRKYSPDKEIFYATSDDGIKWQVPVSPIAVSRNVLWADGKMRKMSKTDPQFWSRMENRLTYFCHRRYIDGVATRGTCRGRCNKCL
jgi:hypothetical protein